MPRVLRIAAGALLAWWSAPLHAGETSLHFSGAQSLTAPALPLGKHTVEAWIRPDPPLPQGLNSATIFDWGGKVILRNSVAGLDYLVDIGAASLIHIITTPLHDGEWHHVAATYDGVQLRLLIDGNVVLAKIVPGDVAGGSAAVTWGAPANPGGAVIPFNGTLDDLRIWSRARTSDEVRETMEDHLAPGDPDLLAYWDLDEGEGQVAADLVAGHDGRLGKSTGADSGDPTWSTEIGRIRKPDPGFDLGFDPAAPFTRKWGEPFEVAMMLATSPLGTTGGVTAWTISVLHDRNHLVIDDVLLAGTAADRRLGDGFARFELLDDGLASGFVSQVVLSAAGGTALPPAGAQKIARVHYRGVLNLEDSAKAVIRYDDRLPASSIGSTRDTVTADGATRKPSEGRLVVNLDSPKFLLAFDPPQAVIPPGGDLAVLVTLGIEGNRAATGINAWSIAVSHDPDVLDLVDITTAGTDTDQFPPDRIFRFVERTTGGAAGFVSVGILSLTGQFALPPTGKSSIVRARYRVRSGVAVGTEARLAFTDGLKGSGAPIDNQATFIGGVGKPEKSEMVARIGFPNFIRGDPNGDGRKNLVDAIFVIDVAIRGRIAPCADACDTNDDGRINVVDVIYLLNNIFRGGADPPPPYPSPGLDPTEDGLTCLQYP